MAGLLAPETKGPADLLQMLYSFEWISYFELYCRTMQRLVMIQDQQHFKYLDLNINFQMYGHRY